MILRVLQEIGGKDIKSHIESWKKRYIKEREVCQMYEDEVIA